jgi:hypothetical protein
VRQVPQRVVSEIGDDELRNISSNDAEQPQGCDEGSMLSEVVMAQFQARCESGSDAVYRHATAWRRFIKQRVGLEGRT